MNCHVSFRDHGPGFEHDVDHVLESDERDSYNRYNGDSDPLGADLSTAYLPEVPIEDRAAAISSTLGAWSSNRVSCMSCHRAHATSAPKAGRWDFNVLRLGDDGVESGSYPIPNPYADPDQRQLCVKCHYNEAEDHGWDRACIECHRESH